MKWPLVDQDKWEFVPFKDHPAHDSMWSMTRGADGNIYVGLCCEHTGGGIAQLYRYNVRKRRLEHCADMAEVTGEPAGNGHAAQGKIHFSLCPSSGGKIFGSTHCTTPPSGHRFWNAYGMWGDPALNYPGGHIFQYDPRTGITEDFGVIFPNEGIPYLLLDEERKRLYGITYPKAHFFRVNLQGRGLVDYGRVSSWYPLAMAFDSGGSIFTSDTNSRLIKYDVKRDQVVFFKSAPYAHPWNRSRRFSWISNLIMAEDGKMYGTHYCNDHLFRFDPSDERPQFEDLGPGAPDAACQMLRALVPDNKGHIYYMAYPQGEFDVEQPLFVRYTIRNGGKEVLGALEVHGNIVSSWLGVCDRSGNMYFKGKGRIICLAIYRPYSKRG